MAQRWILQIEDEESDVLLLRHAFQKAGVNIPVFVVGDCQSALNYLGGCGQFSDRKAYPLPALVLLDLKLPDRSGFEALQWIRRQPALKSTVVVALTSSGHEADIRRAYEFGINAYVVKPSDNDRRVQFAQHLRSWWFGCCQFDTAEAN